MNVRVLIGSKKGAFVLENDSERRDWRVRGPLCEHWPLTHVAADLADRTIYATGGNAWFGPAVWKSNDGGTTWTHSSQVSAYPQGETPVRCAWVAHAAHGRLYRRRRAGGGLPGGSRATSDSAPNRNDGSEILSAAFSPIMAEGALGVTDRCRPRPLGTGLQPIPAHLIALHRCNPLNNCANAIWSAVGGTSPSSTPRAAALSGNMRDALLSTIRPMFGATACTA